MAYEPLSSSFTLLAEFSSCGCRTESQELLSAPKGHPHVVAHGCHTQQLASSTSLISWRLIFKWSSILNWSSVSWRILSGLLTAILHNIYINYLSQEWPSHLFHSSVFILSRREFFLVCTPEGRSVLEAIRILSATAQKSTFFTSLQPCCFWWLIDPILWSTALYHL